MSEQKQVVISRDLILLVLLCSLLPVFRSGLRDELNFWQWVKEHTVWGHPVTYIPEEYYEGH